MSATAMELAGKFLPRRFFEPQVEIKKPLAPARALVLAFAFEVCASVVAFAVLLWYFASQVTYSTTVSSTVISGQQCIALNPKRGTLHYSKTHSENGQFASFAMSMQQCKDYLTQKNVCGDGTRHDVLSLWGMPISGYSMFAQYYSGGVGYLFFGYSNTVSGMTTVSLANFYGKSVSFPQPTLPNNFFSVNLGALIQGLYPSSYYINFAMGASSDAVTPLTSLFDSSLFDSARSKIYPSQGNALDLSTTPPSSISVATLTTSLVGLSVNRLAVNKDIFYGISTGVTYSSPMGIAFSSGCLYVSDAGYGTVRKINFKTGQVDQLGASANPPLGAATGLDVDSVTGLVYLAESSTNLVRIIDTLGNVANSPAGRFYQPSDVAVYRPSGSGPPQLFVADTGNQLVVVISDFVMWTCVAIAGNIQASGLAVDSINNVLYVSSTTSGAATTQITQITKLTLPTYTASVVTSFYVYSTDTHRGLSLFAGKLYVSVPGNSALYGWDLLSSQSLSQSLSLQTPQYGNVLIQTYDIAFDSIDNKAYVSSYGSNNVYVIDYATNLLVSYSYTFSLANALTPRLFSADLTSVTPSAISIWPDSVLKGTYIGKDIEQIGTSTRCRLGNGLCWYIMSSKYSKGILYINFAEYAMTGGTETFNGINAFFMIDIQTRATLGNFVISSISAQTNVILVAVIEHPTQGTVVFTTQGVYSVPGFQTGNAQTFGTAVLLSTFPNFNARASIFDQESLIQVSPSRYLRAIEASFSIYDTFTDTFVSSNSAAAATTHYMLAYTWGVCDNAVTRNLVEVSSSNEYGTTCAVPSQGLYYQSPNVYHAIPLDCIGIPYEKLLTDCSEIKANLKTLVDNTCAASIEKMCKSQHEDNPPFSCVKTQTPTPLTVLSLATGSLTSIWGVLTTLIALVIGQLYKDYKAPATDVELLNSEKTSDELLWALAPACLGLGATGDQVATTEDDAELDTELDGDGSVGSGNDTAEGVQLLEIGVDVQDECEGTAEKIDIDQSTKEEAQTEPADSPIVDALPTPPSSPSPPISASIAGSRRLPIYVGELQQQDDESGGLLVPSTEIDSR